MVESSTTYETRSIKVIRWMTAKGQQVGRLMVPLFKIDGYVMEHHCVCVCVTINKIGSEMMSKINYSFIKRRKRRYKCEKIDN